MTQVQVRMDSKTKKQAGKILKDLGLDLSTAVNMLFKQIIFTKTLPFEIRDENGMRLHKAEELREAIEETKKSKKGFSDVDELIASVTSD